MKDRKAAVIRLQMVCLPLRLKKRREREREEREKSVNRKEIEEDGKEEKLLGILSHLQVVLSSCAAPVSVETCDWPSRPATSFEHTSEHV